MPNVGFLVGAGLVGLLAVVVLAATLTIALTRPAAHRTGLVAGSLPVSLLLPVLATGYGAFMAVRAFAALARAEGSASDVTNALASVWSLIRVAWGGVGFLCLVGLVVGLARSADGRDDTRCSTRRGLVIVLVALLGLVTAALHTHQLARGLRVAAAVTSTDASHPESQGVSEAVLAAEGLQGPGGIGRTSAFIARSMLVGGAGGAVVVVILLGLATTGFILAWKVRVEGGLRLATRAVWTLAAVGAVLVAAGVFDPLRLP